MQLYAILRAISAILQVNKTRIILPYIDPEGLFGIRKKGRFLRFDSIAGVIVEYDREWLAIIGVPPHYQRQVDGLCGDYNGDSRNDLRGRNGTDYSSHNSGHSLMARTWKVFDPWDKA